MYILMAWLGGTPRQLGAAEPPRGQRPEGPRLSSVSACPRGGEATHCGAPAAPERTKRVERDTLQNVV